VFPREHEFTALVMDCGRRRHLAAISLRGESNDLESRIERISGMYFLEKLAGRLGKCDEHVSDVLRKERCPTPPPFRVSVASDCASSPTARLHETSVGRCDSRFAHRKSEAFGTWKIG
jgi:hypothetical protein